MHLFIGSYKNVTHCAACSFAFDDKELPCSFHEVILILPYLI